MSLTSPVRHGAAMLVVTACLVVGIILGITHLVSVVPSHCNYLAIYVASRQTMNKTV